MVWSLNLWTIEFNENEICILLKPVLFKLFNRVFYKFNVIKQLLYGPLPYEKFRILLKKSKK